MVCDKCGDVWLDPHEDGYSVDHQCSICHEELHQEDFDYTFFAKCTFCGAIQSIRNNGLVPGEIVSYDQTSKGCMALLIFFFLPCAGILSLFCVFIQ